MAVRTFQQIRDEAEALIITKQPDILTQPGSVTGDIIDVQADEFSRLYIILDYIDKAAIIVGLETLINDSDLRDTIALALEFTEEELATDLSLRVDNKAQDFGITRIAAVKATGIERFIRATAGNVDIALGTQVRTSGFNAIEFLTTADIVSLPVTLNSITGLYFIDVPIEATEAGAEGTVLANKINQLAPPIVGLTSVTNPSATSNGADEETDQSVLDRIKLAERGRELNTIAGYQRFLLEQPGVLGAITIEASDPLMVRETAGVADLYVIGGEQFLDTQTITYDDATLNSDIVLTRQPVVAVNSVTVNAVTKIAGVDYDLVKDTGGFAGSERAQDVVRFLPAKEPSDGEVVVINYIFNKLISDLQTTLDDNPANNVVNADALVKEGLKVLIDIELVLVIFPSFTVLDVQTAVSAALQTEIDSKGFGASVFTSDLVAAVENTAGVDRVNVPFDKLAKAGDIGASDIIIARNEYPRLNSVVYN